MDRGNTKQEILDASLELFSVQGFEATSISQIAGAVGIRKASLYSHFESKQSILDTIVKDVLQQYGEHSIFARGDWEKDAGNLPVTPDAAVQIIRGRFVIFSTTQLSAEHGKCWSWNNSRIRSLQPFRPNRIIRTCCGISPV